MSTPAERHPGRRRLAAGAIALACLGIAGCAPTYSASGRLAQAATDASAQAQTAALTLRLSGAQRLISASAQTAMSDAIQKTGQDDSSLTGEDDSGALGTAKQQILAQVRRAEDLLAHGQQLVESGAGATPSAAVARQLETTAKTLSKLGQRLEGSG